MDYGPGDRWPRHPQKWWRDALAAAREEGWILEYPIGHWGRIKCPSGNCHVLIFSTGKGAETVAQRLPRLLGRCPHRPRATELVGLIERRLKQAESLIDAAASLRSKERTLGSAEMLVASDALLDDDATWADLDRLVAEADLHEAAADQSVRDGGEEPPLTAGQALEAADSTLARALDDPGSGRLAASKVKALDRRCRDLRTTVADMLDP